MVIEVQFPSRSYGNAENRGRNEMGNLFPLKRTYILVGNVENKQ
jgi:hypothetical protein